MKVLEVRNVNDALARGLEYLIADGLPEKSRNGPVLVAPGPVTTVYQRPLERVLYSATRDANPFFHLHEAIWMLAGRNALAFVQQFNKQFGAYSDDGKTIRGAYGHRWINWFGYNQLDVIIAELKRDPASRRCVLAMWDAGKFAYPERHGDEVENWEDPGDLLATTVDKPCNSHIYFDVRQGRLNITVCCRSNDILWGAYGANAVHFSFLQEYMAAGVGVPVGIYRQMSNNYHLYTDVLDLKKADQIIHEAGRTNYYLFNSQAMQPRVPLVSDFNSFYIDANAFVNDPWNNEAKHNYDNSFFIGVVLPMYRVWKVRKTVPRTELDDYLDCIKDGPWRIACQEWIYRKEERWKLR